MSHFLLVCEPDSDYRTRCIHAAREQLSRLGLPVESVVAGDFAAVWACARAWPGRGAVVNGHAALIVGHAFRHGKPAISPATLPLEWQGLPKAMPEPFEGVHVAASFDGTRLILGADILGRFPVYYASQPGRLIVGSTPELFSCHPLWNFELDIQGLTGLLLLNYFQDNQCLWKNVRRLGAGNVLVWSAENLQELRQYRMRFSDEHFSLSMEEQAEMLDAALRDCVREHVGADSELLLSGGLDSRMLAGYVQGNAAVRRAISWGNPEDLEMQCARRVARHLGLAHERWPTFEEQFGCFGRNMVKWQSLALGANGLAFWQDRTTPAGSGGFLSGQTMDAAIGGTVVIGYREEAGFRDVLVRDSAWGVPRRILPSLLRKEVFGDALDNAVETMRGEYLEFAERDFQRINGYNVLHRHRFHTTAVLGLHGLWGWPLVPAIDTRVLRILAGLPKESFHKRALQKHIVCTRFPALAKLPIDRNSTSLYLLGAPRRIWREALSAKVRKRLDRWTGKHKLERRYYYRIMDFNSAGWRAVRREAEPGRKKLETLFHKEVLDQLVPPPEVPLVVKDIVTDPDVVNPDPLKSTSAAKLLTGLMLWAQERL